MRFIPTRIHGYIDHVVGAFLIVSLWLLGFAQGGAETWVPVFLGAGAIVYSALTDYELGLSRVVPMRAHLAMDGLSGALFLVSPWLFGFADRVWVPHLVFGLFEIGAALTTRTVPYEGRPGPTAAGRETRAG
jgi:hypothetical protein